MGRNRNLNDMISQMRWVLMQNWLGQQSQKRQQENYAAQTGEYYKKEAERRRGEVDAYKEKSKIDIGEANQKFVLEVAKLDRPKQLMAFMTKIQEAGTDEEKATLLPRYKAELESIYEEGYEPFMMTMMGKVDQIPKEKFASLASVLGNDAENLLNAAKESGEQRRFGITEARHEDEEKLKSRGMDIQEAGQGLEAKRIANQEKGLNKKAAGEEPGESQKEYYTRIRKDIADAIADLRSSAKAGGGAKASSSMTDEGESYLPPEGGAGQRGLAEKIVRLRKLGGKARTARLSPGEEEEIYSSADPGYDRKKQFGEGLSKKINTELQGEATPRPSVTAPAPVAKKTSGADTRLQELVNLLVSKYGYDPQTALARAKQKLGIK